MYMITKPSNINNNINKGTIRILYSGARYSNLLIGKLANKITTVDDRSLYENTTTQLISK